MTPDELLALKPGDRVGHKDCGDLCFEVYKVVVNEDEEEDGTVTKTVRRVEVESVYTCHGYEFSDDDHTSNLDKITRPPTTKLFDSGSEILARQLADHEAMAAKSFAGFQLVGGHKDVYPELRKWTFRHPDHGHHSFTLVAWPGYLFVGGDLDECVWTRTCDMLKWAAGSVRNPDYFAGKVINPIKTREWSEDLARAWVWEEWTRRVEMLLLEDCRRSRAWKKDELTIPKLIDTRETLLSHLGDGRSAFTHYAYTHTDWFDGSDPPNLELYSYDYLWARSAVKVALKLLGYTI